MVFRRPKEINDAAIFTGVGGTCQWQFPWVLWRGKGWFQGAMAIASLSVKCLERVIPGYRKFEESFQEDYFGSFIFRLWRFGSWQDIIVDDYLPVLDNQLAYCQPVGTHCEYWAPLLEKAYAKCNRTYESIENGNILDALTDLTGAICEYFTPDVNPPHNLFRLLHMSSYHRSLIVCWRSEKRLTPIGFIVYQASQASTWNDTEDTHRFLHIVTAATKFQTTDGRMLEMVRLKCPYTSEPKWCGRFSDGDKTMWDTVNGDFMERFKPLQNKDSDEYWMTVEDFRCNFGSMIVCSSSEPYVPEGLNLTRKYSPTERHVVLQAQQLTHLKGSSSFKGRSWSLTEQYAPPHTTTSTTTTSSSTTTPTPDGGDDGGRREILDTPHSYKDIQGSSPDSGGSFRSVFSPAGGRVFQFDVTSSPKSPGAMDMSPLHHQRSLTSSPVCGIQRKLAYQPPGRSPLVSEKSYEEPKPDPARERRQSRPLIRGKSTNTSGDSASDDVVGSSGDNSWQSSSKDLLAPFGFRQKNNESDESSGKLGEFPKTQKAKSFDGCANRVQQDELTQTPSVRSKSVSLYQTYQREMEKVKEKGQITVKSATKALTSMGSSCVSKETDKVPSVFRKISSGHKDSDSGQSAQLARQTTSDDDREDPIVAAGVGAGVGVGVGAPISKVEPDKPQTKKQSEEKRGKTLFKSCLSTDEDDDDDNDDVTAGDVRGDDVRGDDVRDDSTNRKVSCDSHMPGVADVLQQQQQQQQQSQCRNRGAGEVCSAKLAVAEPQPSTKRKTSGGEVEKRVNVTLLRGSSSSSSSSSFNNNTTSYSSSYSSSSTSSSFSSSKPTLLSSGGGGVGSGGGSEGNSDFIALVNKVKKVRIRSAPDRSHSDTTPSGGNSVQNQPQPQPLPQSPLSQQTSLRISMTPPTRKYGRHERLNLFSHSSRENSQSATDLGLISRSDGSVASRPHPLESYRNLSLGTVTSLSESNFLASKFDHFCPTGRWSQLVNYHGCWTKRTNTQHMDQNPRILLTVRKLDTWKADVDSVFSGRSHMIISLLQDYRHGSSTANNLIQPIGFCIYKTKYPEKDEKKLLSKLTFVCKEMSNGGSREVIKRTNLEQGSYFIVPFCSTKEHSGEFIVRVLAEKNEKEEKSDCKLS